MTGSIENAIAIIGMAGHFPNADDVESFWTNICQNVDSISKFSVEEMQRAGVPSELAHNPKYVRARGVVSGIEYFDADFFGMNPKEAQITDPQHRLFLECAWEALENAGYDPFRYRGLVGVYGGTSLSAYFLNNIFPNSHLKDTVGDYLLQIGNEKDFLTTRVSYKFNLKGPSLAIQTACSTSLVAVSIACNHLLSYQCDMALAGGVSLGIPQNRGYLYQEGMIFSPDGHCRPFDAAAKGTVPGDGAGIVILKRLQDAIADRDHIYAVIRGYGINNDGFEKIGYSAPSVQGQAEAIGAALAMADINPETICYMEAHGTGTLLGDPIEVKALTQVFRMYTQKNNFCAIGSVKSNIGHLMEAAGIAGLIKASLTLYHRCLPPAIHIHSPNPHIDFANSPFYFNDKIKELEIGIEPQRACVSSFGIGGTNAHVVLEEQMQLGSSTVGRPYQLFLLSAKTKTALKATALRLEQHLQKNFSTSLADIAYTLQIGRKVFEYREAFLSSSLEEARLNLKLIDPQNPTTRIIENVGHEIPQITFIVPAHESLRINWGIGLYQTEPSYKEAIDSCSLLIKQMLGIDIRNILYPSVSQIEEAQVQLKDVLIAQCALFSSEYALAKLWEEWGVIPQSIIGKGIGEWVAACLSGVFSWEEALSLILHFGRYPQGSNPMNVRLKSPKTPFLSNVTGTWITSEEATSFDYWRDQIWLKTTRSIEINELFEKSNRIFLEIGPDKSFIQDEDQDRVMISSLPHESLHLHDDSKAMLTGLGRLWEVGVNVNWDGFYKFEHRYRVPLPTYPFEKKRYWVDPPAALLTSSSEGNKESDPSLDTVEVSLHAIWNELLGTKSIDFHDDFFKIGGDSLLAIQLIAQIETIFGVSLNLNSLIESPSIKSLSKKISHDFHALSSAKLSASGDANLIRLRTGDTGSPLFFIHPIGGQILCYKPVIDSLKYNGAIYGIQAGDSRHESQTIEKMAQEYLSIIKKVQPKGPYHFLGASFGGLIVYEMALQLKASGQSVASLIMLDAFRPDKVLTTLKSEVEVLTLLTELFEGKAMPLNDLQGLSSKALMTKLMESMGLSSLPSSKQKEIFEQIKAHCRAAMNYHPKPYHDKIWFFQAKERFFQMGDVSLAEAWRELAKEGLVLHEAPGNHLTMLLPPNSKHLAQLLDSCLSDI